MRRLLVALLFPLAAGVMPAVAAEAVVRGGTIEFPPTAHTHLGYGSHAVLRSVGTTIVRGAPPAGEQAPVYSGSSVPPIPAATTILRGSRPAEIVRQTPAANLGGDTDGPVLSNPACLYTEPPTCRR